MTVGRPGQRPYNAFFWPWSPRSAVVVVPLALISLLIALGVARSVMSWPDPGAMPWVVLALVVLSLVPLFLLVLDGMARQGGALEWRGFRLSFDGTAAPFGYSVPANAAVPGMPIADSGMESVLRTSEAAARNRILVVDLANGYAWWESRLLMLCAVASRRPEPSAVVFTADLAGKDYQFVGWSSPGALLERLLAVRPELLTAYESAVSDSVRYVAGQGPKPPLKSSDEFMPDVPPSERYLGMHVQRIESEKSSPMTASAVRELFEPVLNIASVDQSLSGPDWLRAALSSETDYLAITGEGRYIGLISRWSIVNRILLELSGQSTPNA
jgi:hypothetical protein